MLLVIPLDKTYYKEFLNRDSFTILLRIHDFALQPKEIASRLPQVTPTTCHQQSPSPSS